MKHADPQVLAASLRTFVYTLIVEQLTARPGVLPAYRAAPSPTPVAVPVM